LLMKMISFIFMLNSFLLSEDLVNDVFRKDDCSDPVKSGISYWDSTSEQRPFHGFQYDSYKMRC